MGLLAALGLAGCGGSGGPLALVGGDPPSGAEPYGQRAARQGTNDTDAGKPVFRLSPSAGQAVSFSVRVRNGGRSRVAVTGVKPDPDRDGVFAPSGVAGAPVSVAPGAEATVTVQGAIRGCERYGGQLVPLAGPDLRLRTPEGDSTQQVPLPYRVDVLTAGCA